MEMESNKKKEIDETNNKQIRMSEETNLKQR